MSVLHTAPLREQKGHQRGQRVQGRACGPNLQRTLEKRAQLERGREVGAGRRPAAAGGARGAGEAGRGLGAPPCTRQRGGDRSTDHSARRHSRGVTGAPAHGPRAGRPRWRAAWGFLGKLSRLVSPGPAVRLLCATPGTKTLWPHTPCARTFLRSHPNRQATGALR